MKINALFLCSFLVIVVTKIYAVEIVYDDDALQVIQTCEKQKKTIMEFIKKDNESKKKSVDIFTFEEKKNKLQKIFKKIEIREKEKRVLFSGKQADTDGVPAVDKIEFTHLAFQYLEKNLPLLLPNREEALITDMKYQRSIHEERDENGEIDKDTHLRTHSVTVTIGRKLYGKPIFNSYVTLGFDAVSKEIIYLDAHNWVSINDINYTDLTYISEERILNSVESRLDKYVYETNGDIKDNITVNEIIIGWFVDETNGILPAIIHHESIFVSENETDNFIEINPAFLDLL